MLNEGAYMNYQFSKEQQQFRQEVKGFLERELPPDWMIGQLHADEELESDEEWAFSLSLRRKMAEKGWLSWWWPKEYGGQGRSRTEYTILREEIGYYGAPGFDNIGLAMVAPTLIFHGTEEQKRKHLLPLARGETTWCEGFSEPNAGSDLASLTTRAVEDGDDFVVDGQKAWTTAGHHADWGIFLFRTDPNAPKHRGISMFLVDLKTPGISRTPVHNLLGFPGWCDIFFDEVKVPRENMVGNQNQGWYVATTTLNNERTGITWVGACRRSLDRLIKYVKEKEPLTNNPIVRHKLASLAIEIELCRLVCYQIAWLQDRGITPVHEASMAKNFANDMSLHVAEAGIQILGLYGQLGRDSKWAPFAGAVQRTFLSFPSWTLATGSPEIQKNIIATMGLGLPR